MKYKSTFYNKSTSFKTQLQQFLTSGIAILLTFVLIASYYDDSRRRYSRGLSRLFNRANNGIKEMTQQEIILAIGISLLAGLIVLFVVDQINEKKKIIVGFEVNEQKNELTLGIRKSNLKKIKIQTLNLENVAYKIKKKRDGMSNTDYECLEFSSNLKIIGFLFLNHEMWENIEWIEFENEIKKIKQLTT